MDYRPVIHPAVWLLWLLAATVPALTTRNPLYLVIVLLAAALVYQAVAESSPLGRDWRLVLRFALTLWAFSLAFNVLTWHYGATPLLSLPDHWPVVGGPITLEALVFGLTSGLALATLLLVFAAFNAAVDHYALLRLLPPFLYQAGLVTSIALTFVPQTVASLRDIREAQILRGHRFRGLRDLIPLLMPLLTTGLERAIQLAESMEARGLAHGHTPSGPRLAHRFGLAVASLAVCAGLFTYTCCMAARTVGLLITLAGLVGSSLVLIRLGRSHRRTHYRRSRWLPADTHLALVSAAVIALTLARLWLDPTALAYDPYPALTWPSFDPVLGSSLVLLAVPALKGVLNGTH